jgi:4-hydroxybutyrate CoA-transferase
MCLSPMCLSKVIEMKKGKIKMKNFVSAEEAVSVIKSGDRVFVQGAAAVPAVLTKALAVRHNELRNVEIIHLHTEGNAPYVSPEFRDSFHLNSFFVGANVRKSVNEGLSDYIPIFLSEIPKLFNNGIIPVDVALVHVSPPDRHGFCSLGVSVDIAFSAVRKAKYVIAQVNPNMPRSHGDGFIHISRFHSAVVVNEPLESHSRPVLTETEKKIGRNCAALIDDGSTLQMGIGAIPDAVLAALHNHSKLGIHTEMFSDGIIELVQKGIITGENKKVYPGRIVSGFAVGTRALYDFIDDNPTIAMLDISFVNDTAVIRKNPKVVAINSAIEIDLTGQVCADSIGTYQFSGVGGQMDFIRGASLSEGGKPVIALPSMTAKGISRIVPLLKPGAGVVTTRAHMHYVVTEYGVADLYGKNLRERAAALINIAHPEQQEELSKAAYERFK